MHIEHLAIWTNDLETLRSFYTHHFNCTSSETYVNPLKQFSSCFLSFSAGTRIELMYRTDISETSSKKVVGLAHIAIQVGTKDEVDHLTNQLEKKGVFIESQPRTTGDGYYESVILDPEGNRIELVANPSVAEKVNAMSMHYSNQQVRRQDRLLPEARALELLKTGEYGVLSMCCTDGGSYGIPLNFVWNGEASIYIHCAPVGRKLKCLDANPSVSFCIVGKTHVISNQFTTEYESLVLECHAHRGLPDEERREALMLFLKKYSPDHVATGEKYAEKAFDRTDIIRLDVRQWSGKSKCIV